MNIIFECRLKRSLVKIISGVKTNREIDFRMFSHIYYTIMCPYGHTDCLFLVVRSISTVVYEIFHMYRYIIQTATV